MLHELRSRFFATISPCRWPSGSTVLLSALLATLATAWPHPTPALSLAPATYQRSVSGAPLCPDQVDVGPGTTAAAGAVATALPGDLQGNTSPSLTAEVTGPGCLASAGLSFELGFLPLHPDAPTDVPLPLVIRARLEGANPSFENNDGFFALPSNPGGVSQGILLAGPRNIDRFRLAVGAGLFDNLRESITELSFSLDPSTSFVFMGEDTPIENLYTIVVSDGLGFIDTGLDGIAPTVGCLPDPQLVGGFDAVDLASGTVISCTGFDPSGLVAVGDDLSATVDVDATISSGDRTGFGVSGTGTTLTNDGFIERTGDGPTVGLDGSQAKITNRGTIESNGFETANAVDVSGDDFELDNQASGRIRSTGIESAAVQVTGNGTRIQNQGEIRTEGLGSTGVALDGDDVQLTNHGTIATSGNEADAVFARGASQVTVNNRGIVRTTGDESDGLAAEGSDIALSNAGRIFVAGEFSSGMFAESDDAILTNQIGGEIEASGVRSAGMAVLGNPLQLREMLRNENSITATGMNAIGMAAAGQNLRITNTTGGVIRTTGEAGHAMSLGIEVFGAGGNASRGEAVNAGRLTVEGADADGIHVFGATNRVENLGDIEALGDGSRGINVIGSEATVDNAAAIRAGADSSLAAIGIRVRGSGEVTNDGRVEVRGSSGFGVNVDGSTFDVRNGSEVGSLATIELLGGPNQVGIASFGSENLVTNFGAILGEQGFSDTKGISLAPISGPAVRSDVRNFGEVSVSGDGAVAIEALSQSTQVVLPELASLARASGQNAVGVRAGTLAASVDNLGTIEASGANAKGVELISLSESAPGGLANSGRIRVTGSDSIGVRLVGGGSDVENDGEIVAEELGSVGIALSDAAMRGVSVTNRGVLSGDTAAFLGGLGDDRFTNASGGETVNSISLGGGDDTLILAGGTFSTTHGVRAGLLDGGAGSDTVRVEVAPTGPLEATTFANFESLVAVDRVSLAGDWSLSSLVVESSFEADGFVSASEIRVADGGRLGGDGGYGGAGASVLVDAGGVVAPGSSPGRLLLDADVEIDGLLEIEIGSTAEGDFDFLEISGSADLSEATLQFVFLGEFRPSLLDAWDFMSIDSELLGAPPSMLEIVGLPGGFDFELEFSGDPLGRTVGRLTTASVPEPGTGLLVVLGLIAFCRPCRRRSEAYGSGVDPAPGAYRQR